MKEKLISEQVNYIYVYVDDVDNFESNKKKLLKLRKERTCQWKT